MKRFTKSFIKEAPRAKLVSALKCVAVLLATLTLSACQTEEPELPLTQGYETLLGEVKSLGGIQVESGVTHLFEDENGVIYYAYSERYDLYGGEYLSEWVEAYGVLREYESKDKVVFEIQHITEPDQEDVEALELEDVDYKDSDFGFSITYPNNWNLEVLRDSVLIESPVPSDVEDEESFQGDNIVIAKTDASLKIETEVIESSDEESEEVIDEDSLAEQRELLIKDYVEANYSYLNADSVQSSLVGVDRLTAYKYENDLGEIAYFIARQDELFEISFYVSEQSEGGTLENTNTFASIVSSFRFIPYGSKVEVEEEKEIVEEPEVEEEVEVVEEVPEEEPVVEEVEETVEISLPETDATQVEVSAYREFTSNPFSFKMSYPSSWWYSGGQGGYDFADEPLDEGVDALLSLRLNVASVEGSTSAGDSVSITSKVGDRYYTLSGPTEYMEVMKEMLLTIEAVEGEDSQ
jgi:hypothetical protein